MADIGAMGKDVSLMGAVTLFIGASILYSILLGIYNVALHPLSSYPGPPPLRAYRFPWAFTRLSGRLPFEVAKFHAKYGPVVRTAPDELSYIDSRALKPTLGHHNPATEGFSEFDKDRRDYLKPSNGARNMLSAETANHGRMRKFFSHSFSDRGLREMQPRIQSYVNTLIDGLREVAQNGAQWTDILEWYNWTTFDILGDLAFGESFHCLETKRNDPWIQAIFGNVKAGNFLIVAARYHIEWLFLSLAPKRALEQRRINLARSAEKMEQRIKLGTSRGDFWDTILEKSLSETSETKMSKEEMTRNADLLVLGGSETTATLLSGTTYLLLKNPHIMKKLVDEVRSKFKSETEIDFISVNKLDYMLAVFDEALRLYPPVADQGRRITPSPGAMILGKWVPGGTSVMVQTYSANYSPTNFHCPEAFVPERWLPNPPAEFAKDDRAARSPFSAGPRNCIGRNLAYAEMRLILSKIIWNFDLELDETRCGNWIGEQKIYALWEKNPLYVRLRFAKR